MISPQAGKLQAGTAQAHEGPVFLAPLRIEAAALRRGAPRSRIEKIGMGPRRAGVSAERLARELAPNEHVVVAGVAGGLRRDLLPGDVVVASRLVHLGPDGAPGVTGESLELAASAELAERLGEELARGAARGRVPNVVHGPVGCAQAILSGDQARDRAAEAGVLAVEMESIWCSALAADHELHVVRVVLDVPGRDLVSFSTPGAVLVAFRSLVSLARSVASLYPRSVNCSPLEV